MKYFLSTFFLLLSGILSASNLVIHPVPKEIIYSHHNDDYTVKVRLLGGDWQDLYEYDVKVDLDKVENASMVQFDMGAPVEIMVKKNNGHIIDAKIRPLSKEIAHTVKENCIFFTLNKPQYLSIEFNGDRLHNLHLFANPLETEVYEKSEEGVMYFGPGIHRPSDLPNNQIRIPSNSTVYLAPGSVVRAKLLVDRAENVRIIGRGILDTPIRGVEVTHSTNVLIDGITIINPDHYTVFGGEADGLTIRNLKSFSCKGWSDGIDMMSCKNVLIDNVFMRNSDDCITVYGHRWSFYGDARNITVQNSILWADVAHPINIGGHGNAISSTPDKIENIIFRNIDILEHDEDDTQYQGCMALGVADGNLVKDVLFEDIRVEDFQEGRLFSIAVCYNEKYSAKPGGGVENVVFRNINYNGIGENPSLIMGYDEKRMVKNITFENVIINGKKMTNIKDFIKNTYISNIQVK